MISIDQTNNSEGVMSKSTGLSPKLVFNCNKPHKPLQLQYEMISSPQPEYNYISNNISYGFSSYSESSV